MNVLSSDPPLSHKSPKRAPQDARGLLQLETLLFLILVLFGLLVVSAFLLEEWRLTGAMDGVPLGIG